MTKAEQYFIRLEELDNQLDALEDLRFEVFKRYAPLSDKVNRINGNQSYVASTKEKADYQKEKESFDKIVAVKKAAYRLGEAFYFSLERLTLKELSENLLISNGTETQEDIKRHDSAKALINKLHPDIAKEAQDAIFSLGVFYGRYIEQSEQASKRKDHEEKKNNALIQSTAWQQAVNKAAEKLATELWEKNPKATFTQAETRRIIFPILIKSLQEARFKLTDDKRSMLDAATPDEHSSLSGAIRALTKKLGLDDMKKAGRPKKQRANLKIVKPTGINIFEPPE